MDRLDIFCRLLLSRQIIKGYIRNKLGTINQASLRLNKQLPVLLKFIKLFYHEPNILFAFVLPDT